MATLCALLMNQALYGPLSHLPIESIGLCNEQACAIYWIEDENCEEVPNPDYLPLDAKKRF